MIVKNNPENNGNLKIANPLENLCEAFDDCHTKGRISLLKPKSPLQEGMGEACSNKLGAGF